MLAQSIAQASDGVSADADDRDAQLQKILGIVRSHLNMEVAFLSEFSGGRRYFRFVDTKDRPIIVAGGSDPLEDSYCQRVVDGRLPQLMQDARQNGEALTLTATNEIPVGAHMSIPIRLSDGSLYGTLCCFSTEADDSLNQRDLTVLKAFGEIVSELMSVSLLQDTRLAEIRKRIAGVIANRAFESYYQPIYRVADNYLLGFEALTRFKGEPYRSPDVWLHEADEVGMSIELEYAMARMALAGLQQLAAGASISVNLSPEAIMTPQFDELLAREPLRQITLEITEHAAVADYAALNATLAPYRERGLRIAADDAGAGYSCFRHVLELRPDVIKLDISLTRNIDTDSGRAALASALTIFGRSIGAVIVAEGVETASELVVMREIGVTKVQGYLLGKPGPISVASRLPMIAPIELGASGLELRSA